MTRTSAKTALISLAAMPFALAASPSAAQTDEVRVQYADLDLSSESDMSKLLNRVRVAIRTVCGPVMPAPFTHRRATIRCAQFALEDAQEQIAQIRQGKVEFLSIRLPQERRTTVRNR